MTENISKVYLYVVLLAGALMLQPAFAAIDQDVDTAWDTAKSESSSREELLAVWKAENRYKESGLYHYRLGWIYFLEDNLAQAELSFERASELPSRAQRDARLSLGDIYVRKAADDKSNAGEHLREAERRYVRLMEDHPDFPGVYTQYGILLMIMDDYKKALEITKRGLEIEPSVYAYRTVTIAAQQLDDFPQSAEAFKIALSMDQSLLSDKDFVVSGAVSVARLGHIQDAKNVLVELSKRSPQVRTDEAFVQAVDMVRTIEGRK